MRKLTLVILIGLFTALVGSTLAFAQDPDGDTTDFNAECGFTGETTSGPYYIAGTLETNNLNYQELPGRTMVISGMVFDGTTGEPLANAQIDIWQTDANGDYWPAASGDAADFDPDALNLRGIVYTDEDGTYEFTSIEPGEYPGRPRHIHYHIAAEGYFSIFTQTYWANDPAATQSNGVDPNAEDCRLLTFEDTEDGGTAATFNIYLQRDPDAVVAAPEFTLLNLNTATSDDFLTVPGVGDRMVREFEEYRPYISIQQFRREIGKYVDDDQVAAYEAYVYVPIDVNESDAATLQQIPGVDEDMAAALMGARPFESNAAFLSALAELVTPSEATYAANYLEVE